MISRIDFNCNVIDGILINGKPSNTLYSVKANSVGIGRQFELKLEKLLYLPIVDIHNKNWKFWFTTDKGETLTIQEEGFEAMIRIKQL